MKRERLLIFRPDNIGDVLLFSGALKHIRDLYPRDHITLAVQPHIVNLIEVCPYVDTCIPIDKLTWWGNPRPASTRLLYVARSLVRKLNGLWNLFVKPFNVIIYPVKSPQLHHLEIILDLKASRTFGMAGCNLNAPQGGYPCELQPVELFSDYVDVSANEPCQHELLTTLVFLRFLGCNVSTVAEIRPLFWLCDSDKNLLDEERKDGKLIIGLFPGGSFPQKCWNPRNYSAFAKLMGGSSTYVIFGGLADKDIAREVESALLKVCGEGKIINLTGKTSLRELAKSVKSCDLFLSTDTSGLHMAIIAGVPSIGIVGGGHYGRFIPWGDPSRHIFLTRKVECFGCNWNCRKGRFECIQEVQPEDVAYNANRLLQAYSGQFNRTGCQI